jgi:hypothetical protein
MSKIEKLSERDMRLNYHDDPNEDQNTVSIHFVFFLLVYLVGEQYFFEFIQWPSALIPIDLPDTIIRPEVRSEEKRIQAEREQMTLALLVFKHNLPDSASEPDANNQLTYIETKLIPLEDTGNVEHEHHHASYAPSQQQMEANLNLYDLIYKVPQFSPPKPFPYAEPNIELNPQPIPGRTTDNVFSLIPNNHVLTTDPEELKIILKNVEIQQTQIVQQDHQQQEENVIYLPNPNPPTDKGLETFLASLLPPNSQNSILLNDEKSNRPSSTQHPNEHHKYSRWSNSGWQTQSHGYHHNKSRSSNYTRGGSGFANNRPNFENRMHVRDNSDSSSRHRDGYRSAHRSPNKSHTRGDNSNNPDTKTPDQTKPSFRWV